MARVANLAAEVTADIGPLKSKMNEAGNSVRDFTRKARTSSQGFDRDMRTATRSSGAFGRGVQNAAFQVGDFAVQVGGGTSAVRAMSMQLPQLLGGFGVMGAVLGATVAILGPFAQKLFESADAGKRADEVIGDLSGSLESMRGRISGLQSLQEELNAALRAQAGASAAGASVLIANTQKEFAARQQLIEVEKTLLRLRSQDAQSELRALRSQQEAARNAMLRDLQTLGPGATGTGVSDAGGFAGGGLRMDEMRGVSPSTFDDMEQRRLQIQRLEAELQLVEIAAQEADDALSGVFSGESVETGDSGGGGGSAASRRAAAIKDELNDLTRTTESELSTQLKLWEGFFGDMAGALQGGNEKLLKISKAFGAAQALISAYQGAAEALKLPFPANLAAYAKVLATGLGAVNAIQNVTAGGGGGRGGSAGGAAAAPTFSQSVAITLNGSESATYSKGQIRGLINQINEAVEGGARIRLA